MRLAALLLLASLVASAAPVQGDAETSPARYLVGYDPSDSAQAHLAIQVAGGSIERASAELGFAVVRSADPETFLALIQSSPWIDYTEPDDAIAIDGGQWNGAEWNGAQWNGGQWNGAQWNGGQWNGGQWNGAQWNGGQWNGAQWNQWSTTQQEATRWTFRHFGAPEAWRYDRTTSDPGLLWQWGLWASDAVALSSPSGSTLCVLDTGVAWNHPDLRENYVDGWNAIRPTASAYDDAGHGTHIAGIGAARAGNAFGIAGVSNAGILNVKVLDAEGQGLESDLAFGLVWCALKGADVAVMALSATDDGPTMDRALQFAADHDVLLMGSAGNDGAAVSYPARDARVVAVSAVDGELQLAAFSNRGADIELAAPGVHMLGTFLDDGFAFGSGTSQAVALAAGVAAFVRADPTLSAGDAREALHKGAVDLGAPGRDPAFGHGLVSASALR